MKRNMILFFLFLIPCGAAFIARYHRHDILALGLLAVAPIAALWPMLLAYEKAKDWPHDHLFYKLPFTPKLRDAIIEAMEIPRVWKILYTLFCIGWFFLFIALMIISWL